MHGRNESALPMRSAERQEREIESDGPFRRATIILMALVLTVASAACANAAFEGPPIDDASPTRPSDLPMEPTVTTVEIGHGGGIDVEVGEGGVWVTTRDGLVELDPATNAIVQDIPFEGAFDLDIGSGSIWVTNTYVGVLARIDPASGAMLETFDFRTITPYCVDAASEAVWVTGSGDDGGDVVRIDPETNEIVARIHVGPGEGAGGIGCVVADDQAVWITRGGKHDSLIRIDPTTNEIIATINISNWDYWNEMALEGGSLWVAAGPHVTLADGTGTSEVQVLRIDRNTNEVWPPIIVGHGMFGLGSGDGSLWVYDGFTDGLTQIDASTGAIVRQVDIHDGGSSWGGDPGIDAADGTVWMAGTSSLNRIDLAS